MEPGYRLHESQRRLQNCYAERLAKRLQAMGNHRYENGFRLTLHDDVVDLPRSWKSGRKVFVNSMSDLFHDNVPLSFIHRVFETMRECPQHVFQVLTKRSSRLRRLATEIDWPANVWMGVSVEDDSALSRFRPSGGSRRDQISFVRTSHWLVGRY